ncbi:hypothetical protein BDS110ZK14_50060 [Bradyrhizobium diazoefficiens]|nr:hypothetical protein H12S4_07370 [Bradyrhizobium diazoefficiens]BCF31670.1 hypothetical protein XF15B_07410 [Bradyrhizobium diazoefficiens]
MDLADLAGGLEVSSQFRPPHRDPDPVIALAQRPDDISAQKPRSAENRDESFQIRCHGDLFLRESAPDEACIEPVCDAQSASRNMAQA